MTDYITTANTYEGSVGPIKGDFDNVQYSLARVDRDALLVETDIWASPIAPEQEAYRQALRDIPNQIGFPTNITWPIKP